MSRALLIESQNSKVLTGGRRTTADNIRQVLAEITAEALNIPDDTTDVLTEGGVNLYYTDARVKLLGDTLYSPVGHTHTFASLTAKPTTLAGYSIDFGAEINSAPNITSLLAADQFSIRDSLTGLFSKATFSSMDLSFTLLNDVRYNYFGKETVASASSVVLDPKKEYHHITGTVTIAAFSDILDKNHIVTFDGSLTLTSSANLILPTGADILTAVGDTAILRAEGSGVWKVISYSRASGTPVALPLPGMIKIVNQTTGVITSFTDPDVALAASVVGDLIVVDTGTYTITTTAANGMHKDGVNWLVMAGVTFNKSTAGDMWNIVGFSIGANVYGEGDYNCTGSAGHVFNYSEDLDFDINYKDSTNSVASKRVVEIDGGSSPTNTGRIKGRSAIATGSFTFQLDEIENLTIDCNLIKSTASVGILVGARNNSNARFWNINCAVIESTVGPGFSGQVLGRLVVNCSWTNEVVIVSGVEGCVWNGDIDKLFASAGNLDGGTLGKGSCNFTGTIQEFVGSDEGDIVLSFCKHINVPTTMDGNLTVEVLGDINASKEHTLGGTGDYHIKTVTGKDMWFLKPSSADVFFYSHVIGGNNVAVVPLTISSGLVCFYLGFTFGDATPNTTPGAIDVTAGGTLDLVAGNCENLGSAESFDRLASCYVVDNQGGNVIIRSATLKTGSPDVPAVVATNGAQDIHIQGSPFTNRSENGGFFPAKAQRERYTVDDVLETEVVLDDGSGEETFNEPDTATFNTKAKLAEAMVDRINYSGSLDLIASQDTPGTDEFFYVDAGTPGTAFTTTSDVNLTRIKLRINSSTLNNPTGGSVTPNINVL